MPALRRDRGLPPASEWRDKDGASGEGREVEGKSHCHPSHFRAAIGSGPNLRRMMNELLEVEVSRAIFTHIITVSVATVTAVRREGRQRGGRGRAYSTIHMSSSRRRGEREVASDEQTHI